MAADPQPTFCATHPKVETYLRCGRCDKPICPRCLVQTPVGSRCRACARVRRLPTYDVRPRFLLRGAAAGLAVAIVAAILMRFLPVRGLFFLLLGALYGYLVAEAISVATNRKRGSSLGWVAVLTLFLGFGLGNAALVALRLDDLAVGARVVQALLIALRPDFDYLAIGIGALIAYNRLR